jgi:hypothetical protein
MKNKVGLIVEHYSFRSDIRDLIDILSEKVDLILYINKCDEIDIKERGYKYRIINENKFLKNILLKRIFSVFRKKHSLHKDAISWKLRKINSKIGAKQLIQILYFRLYEYFPSILSYDWLLKRLLLNNDIVSDLDALICLTDIRYDELLAKCAHYNVRLYVYVYSWDHPVKLTKIPKDNTIYFTWNNGLKDDLVELHSIDPEKIKVIGSTQFSYIEEYKRKVHSKNLSNDSGYIYCIGTKARIEMFAQEVELIKYISRFIVDNKLNIKIIFRPYPNIQNKAKSLYEDLKSIQNIEFDMYDNDKYIFTKDKIFDKFDKINEAIVTIHTGGTFGVEACYLNSVNLFFTYKESQFNAQKKAPYYLNLSSISNQYHLNKYLNFKNANVINCEHELDSALYDILIEKNNNKFHAYNNIVSKLTKLDSMDNIAIKISKTIFEDCKDCKE